MTGVSDQILPLPQVPRDNNSRGAAISRRALLPRSRTVFEEADGVHRYAMGGNDPSCLLCGTPIELGVSDSIGYFED